MANLLSPIEIKGKTIKNRLVFPPVVCFNYSTEKGFVEQRNIDHYEIMAKGGTGLVIVEATCINPNARLSEKQLGIWDDAFVEGLSKLAKVINENGAVSLIQIHHAGYKSNRNVTDGENIFTASEYTDKNGVTTRAATKADIDGVIKDFGNAARRAYEAGFNGIEIHGAHDYLISQFLSADVNKRDDEYGSNRALLALEIIEEIKKNVPKDFILAMRLGASDDNMTDGIKYARMFEDAGVDLLNVSSGHIKKEPADMEHFGDEYHWVAELGMNVKKHVNIPVICVFGINSPEMADKIIKDGLCDFAASAKGLLADPYWIKRYEKQEETYACLKCSRCLFYSDGALCPSRKRYTMPV